MIGLARAVCGFGIVAALALIETAPTAALVAYAILAGLWCIAEALASRIRP